MYAVITLDNDGQPTEHATASTYSVALAHADQSLHNHTEVIIAYKHAHNYQPLVTLNFQRKKTFIPHRYTLED